MTKTRLIQFGTPPSRAYDGIMMRANPTLHEEAFDLFREHVKPGAKVVDVGSGQGAFAARLRDNGYDVTSVDKDPSDFRAKDISFVELNFDVPEQIAQFRERHAGGFDAAVGMEVIEHVENPWEYCRFLLSLVRPGGIVFLTTPNAESVHSRVELLFTGLFAHFTREDFTGSGHINPMTFHELQLIAEGVRAEIVDARAICSLPWLIASRRPTVVAKSAFSALLRPFMGKRAQGDIICFVLRRTG